MKKFLSIIISAFFLTGCTSKTNDTAVSEPIEEIPTEPVFTEYTAEDFREIDVNLNIQEGKLPVKYTEYSFNYLAEAPKLAKCKKDYVIDDEIEIPEDIPEWYIEDYTQEKQRNIDTKLKLKETPTTGFVCTYSYCEDKFLFIRNYDEICGDSHCFDICEYDLTTGEISCLFSYDASIDEIGYSLFNLTYIKGQLYCSGSYTLDDEYGRGIYAIDTENNRIEKMDCAVIEEDCDLDYWIDGTYFGNTYLPDRLICYGYHRIDEDNLNLVEYEYDFEQCVWNKIYNAEFGNSPYTIDGKVVSAVKDDEKKLVCELDGVFRLETGLKAAELKTVSNGKVVVGVTDSLNNFLYIFDLEKRECYKYNMVGRGEYFSVYPMGDYLYIKPQLGYVPLLLIPELGAAFELKDIMNLHATFDGKRIWSNIGIMDYYDYTDPYKGNNYSGDVTIGRLEMEE